MSNPNATLVTGASAGIGADYAGSWLAVAII
jgi:short-subunit dehydrogenase